MGSERRGGGNGDGVKLRGRLPWLSSVRTNSSLRMVHVFGPVIEMEVEHGCRYSTSWVAIATYLYYLIEFGVPGVSGHIQHLTAQTPTRNKSRQTDGKK